MSSEQEVAEHRFSERLRKPRQIIKVLDARYVIPGDLDPIRILQSMKVANEDGGTGWHWEFVTLCEEVEVEA